MDNTLVLYPYLKSDKNIRTPSAVLAESVSLAKAIGLNVAHEAAVPLREIRAGTFLGKGTIDSFRAIVKENDVAVVILACRLSPLQQRNLEKEWQTKVIDKTALILEIFGQRARTREGVLQVELAHLTYARSRLVRSWTHLERQRGGAGFLGGPGETQIELDRRLIDEDIVRIKKELAEVKKTRELHRKARRRVPFPIVALVGYTNAGKSTLFNYLTKANVFAKDMLFATLDPTMRHIKLPSGQSVILSDTVGFVSDLPTELVMAFRATLEEVAEADVIIHVRDYFHPDSRAQKKDVEAVLKDLGLTEKVDGELIEALNKIDLFDPDEQVMIRNQKARKEKEWPISAITGDGVADLLRCVESVLNQNRSVYKLMIPIEDGATLAKLYRKAQILRRSDNAKTITVYAKLTPEDAPLFQSVIVKTRKKK